MLHAVIFDLDGTLLDTIPDIAGSLNHALATFGLPTHSVETCKGFVGGGIREAVCRAVPEDASEAVIEQVLTAYHDDYPRRCTQETTCYPGVRELLDALHQDGVLLGILSNKTEATTRRIISFFFPDIPFRCVFGRAEGRPLKPDPAAAAPVLEALGLPPSQMAYVGDSGTDMLFAKEAGMLPAAAPWGYRSRQELVENGAVLIPENPAELLELLRRQMNQP